MSVVITANGNHGPYKTVEVLADRLRCDGDNLPFTVIGAYTISQDDGLAPVPTVSVADQAAAKAVMVESVNDTIAAILHKFTRFEVEYVRREAAARAFKAGGYQGDPGVWITAFSTPTGMSNQSAADAIIAQADGLHAALEALGALRMAKYGVQLAANLPAATAAYNTIIAQVNAIARQL